MKRRHLLKQATTTVIGIGALPGLSVLLKGCGVERLTDYQPAFLSTMEYDAVWKMAELILPRTATPGAADAGVAPYIDLLFSRYFEADERDRLHAQLRALLESASDQLGRPFVEWEDTRQTDFMSKLEGSGDYFFKTFKSLVLWGFFSSEAGMKSMNYQPIPGKYEGCIPLDPEMKSIVGNR